MLSSLLGIMKHQSDNSPTSEKALFIFPSFVKIETTNEYTEPSIETMGLLGVFLRSSVTF